MSTSLYSYIKSSITPEGTLPRDFHLPREESDDPKKVKFAAGAMDGIQIYHMGFPKISDEDRGQMLDIMQLANKGETAKANEFLTTLTNKYRAITIIDDLQNVIRDNSEQLNVNNIANYAVDLALNSDNTELVKTGLIILELINTSDNQNLRQIVKTLGLSDEFTIYSVFIIRHWPDGQMEILDLARKVRSWGRVHCVYFIEPENDEIKDWLLFNGIDNDVLSEYSALDVFNKIGVESMLDDYLAHPEEDPDLDKARAILNIIKFMLDEGPVEGISAVENPPLLLDKVLRFTEGRNLDREMREIVGRVKDLKEKFDGN